jgi:ParB/Sulfiredoxin domain
MSESLPALLRPAGNGSTVGPGGAPAADAAIDLVPAPVWSSGLSADRIGPVQWWSVSGLRPYAPHFIEIPSFRGSPSWQMLRQLLKESGVRDPLLVLPDGRVVDGVHRLELARALGLSEVPVRVVDLPENCSVSDRMQLETTRAALDAGRRRIDPPHLRRLVLDLTQAEVQLRAVNRRAANLRRGRVAGAGPSVPTQRERGQAVGMSARAVRRLDRIAREAPADLLNAVRTGTLSPKAADRRLAPSEAAHVPTGPVRAREMRAGGDGEPGKDEPVAADPPRGIGSGLRSVTPQASPGSTTPVGDAEPERRVPTLAGRPVVGEPPGESPTDAAGASAPSSSPAVEAFMAACRSLQEVTRDFVQETAHWIGERREQRNLTIWQGIRQLEEHLDWMEAAGETRPGEA